MLKMPIPIKKIMINGRIIQDISKITLEIMNNNSAIIPMAITERRKKSPTMRKIEFTAMRSKNAPGSKPRPPLSFKR